MTRWIFENPWPLIAVLTVAGTVAIWRGSVDASRLLRQIGLVSLLLALAAYFGGRIVVTPGEHAERITRALVAAAEAGDTDAAMALFAPNAVLNYGRRENQGVAIDQIRDAFATLESRHRIASNRIRRLKVATLDARTGEVELSCSTSTATYDGAIPTDWILRVRRDDASSSWRIDRLTFETLFAQPPTPGVWR
jgi:hypothetical protein